MNKGIKTCLLLLAVTAYLLPLISYAQESVRSNPVTTRFGNPPVGTGGNVAVAPDGQHVCPVAASFARFSGDRNAGTGQYSYICGHCLPIYNANDIITHQAGGTAVVAVVDGKVEDWSNPVGGPALHLIGIDNQTYYYAHLKREGLVLGAVKAGQVIGHIAAGSDTTARNNGVAHVHFSASTAGGGHSFAQPSNLPAGRLLDSWCGNNVCTGRVNEAYRCGG